MHSLSLEVRCKWSLAVWPIKKSLIPVSTEGTGENTDVAKYTLQRLVKNIGHFVLIEESIRKVKTLDERTSYLKVLRCSKRACQKKGAAFSSVHADPVNQWAKRHQTIRKVLTRRMRHRHLGAYQSLQGKIRSRQLWSRRKHWHFQSS